MFFGRKRRGPGLIGILILLGLLYYTGAGEWLWNRVKELPAACYDMLGGLGTNIGSGVCDGADSAITALDDGFTGIGDQVRSWFGGSRGGKSYSQMEHFSQQVLAQIGGGSTSLTGLTSTGERLKAMMRDLPASVPSSADAATKLRTSLDQYVIGQRFLQNDENEQAMPWFQKSAEQPGGYGVLSQLTLGDMYRTGSNGASADSSAAIYYYKSAQHSLATLKESKTQQAKQLLASLPVEADALNQQLSQILQQLQTPKQP